MTGPINTHDPAADPRGFLVDFLSRYFKPGLAESVIRTWVPVGVGTALTWVLSWLATNWHWDIALSQQASTTAGMVSVAVVTAAYYALARLVEKRWPKLGRLLISLNLVKAPPVYAKTEAAAQAVNAADNAADPSGRPGAAR